MLPKLLRQKMARYGDAFMTACERKKSYPTWAEAEKAALLLQDDQQAGRLKSHRAPKKGVMLAYQCPDCGLWHVAHYPQRWLRSMWAKAGMPTGTALRGYMTAIGGSPNQYAALSADDRRHLFVTLATPPPTEQEDAR